VNVVLLNVELHHLDIGIEFWNVREELLGILLQVLYKYLTPISRDPYER
jgi:hypothetical protein